MKRLRLFRSGDPLPAPLRHNFIHLYLDIAWWGLYQGSTASFLGVYAARCGATVQQIGLLTAAPALVMLLLSLPSGWMVHRMQARKATALGSLLARGMFLFYALVPWLLPPSAQVPALILVTLVLTIPNTLLMVGFGKFLMEGVPPEYRGQVVANRNAIFAILTFVIALLCGRLLTYFPFPQGYVVVFFIGFIGGVMTTYHIWQVHPVNPLVSDPQSHPISTSEKRRLLPAIDFQSRHYLTVLGLLFFFNMTNNMVAPLIPNFTVNTLQLSDAVISIGTAIPSILAFLVSLVIARFTRLYGNRKCTAFGAVLVSLHTVALAFAQGSGLYYASAMFGGTATGILNAAQYNYHLENVPKRDQAVWLSWSVLIGNAAVLIGSLAGPRLSLWVSIPIAFLILGLFRLLAGFAFWRWG
jgi:MFS family permease